MSRRVALAVFLVACGGGPSTAKSAAPADLVVSEVDGGTVVGGAMPDARKLVGPREERRPLTSVECRAFAIHMREIATHEQEPGVIEAMIQGHHAICQIPSFTDEVFDCLVATKSMEEIRECMNVAGVPLW